MLLTIALLLSCTLSPRVLPAQAHAEPPSLFVSGKPVIGGVVTLELAGLSPNGHMLLLSGPGAPFVGLPKTLASSLLAKRTLIPVLLGSCGALDFDYAIPDDPSLVGSVLYAELISRASHRSSGVTAILIGAPLPLESVDDFAYRLQGTNGSDLTLVDITGSAYDLCIVDFSRDGSTEFTASEVAALRSAAEPNRIRLAYMSIGEAEDYRWYWNHISPSLVAASNPNWPGNYKVQYWQPEWKQVILTGNSAVGKSYLDRIIDAGFDGVYLDVVDAFEFFGPAEASGSDWRRDAAREMADLLIEIAYHARIVRGRPDFLVVPQNGSNIIEAEWYPADSLRPCDAATPAAMAASTAARLFATLDGIGVEDVFYGGPNDQDNPYQPDNYLLGLLQQWTGAGLTVLCIDYLTQQVGIDAFYDIHAPAQGFVPYATVRALDSMTVNKGHPPD